MTWTSFHLTTSDLSLIDMYCSQEDQEVEYFWKAPIYPDCFSGLMDEGICPKMQRATKKRPVPGWNRWGQTPGNGAMAALGWLFFLPPAMTCPLPVGFCGDRLDCWSTKHSATLKWVEDFCSWCYCDLDLHMNRPTCTLLRWMWDTQSDSNKIS